MFSPFFYYQAVALALSQIWANKLRAFLTALGIIIGVASVTSVIAALSGLKTMVLKEFETFGASKLFIFPNWPNNAPHNKYRWEDIRLKTSELMAIAEHCPSIAAVTPITNYNAPVQYRQTTMDGITINGIWPDWHDIENRHVLQGRPFTASDERHGLQICLVNDKAIAELHLDSDPVGDHLLIGGRRFLIIGVVETLQPSIFGFNTAETEVFVPYSTAEKMQPPWFFFRITAKLASPTLAEEAKSEVQFVLRKMRTIRATDPDTFEVHAMDQVIDQFKALAAGITAVAGGIVGISLLVGGIGIMNIMLVSVSERTREIGLRKAVGATPAAILMQFLLEAVTLCFVGGVIGVAIGQLFAFAITKLPSMDKLDATVPPWAVGLAFAFCAFVGVVFGMFPAIKAARLDPIEALRHE